MKPLFAVCFLFLVAGCASAPPQTEVIAQQDPNLVCDMTYVTGSAVPKRKCETPEEKERQRKLSKEMAETLSKSVIIPKKDGSLN